MRLLLTHVSQTLDDGTQRSARATDEQVTEWVRHVQGKLREARAEGRELTRREMSRL